MGGYNDDNGKYAHVDEETLLSLTGSSSSSNGSWVKVRGGVFRGRLTVDNSSASPTVDVAIQTRRDSSDSSPRTVASFTQATGDGSEYKVFAGLDREIRAAMTQGGTGTVDVVVEGEIL